MKPTKHDIVLQMARQKGQLRPRDLDLAGIAPAYLQRLSERGELVRQGRGIYMLPNAEITEHHTLAEVGKRVPHAVICLLSALRFHEIGTETPGGTWVALMKGMKCPNPADLRLEVVRFSEVSMSEGVEAHVLEGVTVRITSPARTIVDCFRYRHKIGLDIPLEALREGLRRRVAVAEIRRLSALFRMERVMRPYLEVLL
jgi:predicted transcriptional regulator of viral defense system